MSNSVNYEHALLPAYWDHLYRPDIFASYHNGFHREDLANLIGNVVTADEKQKFIDANGDWFNTPFLYSLRCFDTFRPIDRAIKENFFYPIGISWWMPVNNNWIEQHVTIDNYVLEEIAANRCKILLYNGAEGWSVKTYWYTIIKYIINVYPQLNPSDFIVASSNVDETVYKFYDNVEDVPHHYPSVGNENLLQLPGVYTDFNVYCDVITDNIKNNAIRKYKFLCMNRRPNAGRFAIATLLSQDKSKGLLSFSVDTLLNDFNSNVSVSNQQLIDTYKSEINNQASNIFQEFSTLCPNIYKEFSKDVKFSLPWFIDDNVDVRSNPIQDSSVFKFSNSYLNIVTETYFHNSSNVHLSEKSFKPIWFMQPFVIVGVKGALQGIKSLGYETFNHWIDESYDLIESPEERVYSLYHSSKKFYDRPVDDINKDMQEILPILVHNHQLIKYRNINMGYEKLYNWKTLVMSKCF